MPVIEAVQRQLRLESEGDTSDGNVSLRYNTCLGACAQAPVMSVDHHLIGRVSSESALKRLPDKSESN